MSLELLSSSQQSSQVINLEIHSENHYFPSILSPQISFEKDRKYTAKAKELKSNRGLATQWCMQVKLLVSRIEKYLCK